MHGYFLWLLEGLELQVYEDFVCLNLTECKFQALHNYQRVQNLIKALNATSLLYGYGEHWISNCLCDLQEIQERIPSDPLEAELLMMAEAVAGGGVDTDTDSDNDNTDTAVPEGEHT